MKTSIAKLWRTNETLVLSIFVYGVLLTYIYQYSQIANKNSIFGTDEFFYYMEAKAIAVYNIYQTPFSLDGNTSIIGDFGSHGISYAIKDGWLSKLFFHSNDPPLVFINFITCLSTFLLILMFKPIGMKARLKIALALLLHNVLYSYTLSYMQETIQFLFAIIALRLLYLIYLPSNKGNNKYIYYYLLVVAIAVTFRYSWFVWGLGVLPIAMDNSNKFTKWIVVMIYLTGLAMFIGKYIYAPYPYGKIVAYRILNTDHMSLTDILIAMWQKFTENIKLFIFPQSGFISVCMRLCLIPMLFLNTWLAISKRNKFVIACTTIAWTYLLMYLIFYFLTAGADERPFGILFPLLVFPLIGICDSAIFYPVITIQLFLFPSIVTQVNQYTSNAIANNASQNERAEKIASYSNIKDLILDNKNTSVDLSFRFAITSKNCFTDFPLKNSRGYPIHYRAFVNGPDSDIRKNHIAEYLFTDIAINDTTNYKLLYNDRWMYFYKIVE